MKGVFVTATNTDVGKTWVGCGLLNLLIKQEKQIHVRKPIESGWPEIADLKTTDAWKLANAAKQTDNLDTICPHRFTAPISPDRAAMLEGQTLLLENLSQVCLKDVNQDDFLYVEGAGGFYSPLCRDGLNADLAVSLQLPVILVVENRLGCINQALLNVEAIAKRGLTLKAIVLNSVNASEKHIDENAVKQGAMNNLEDIQKRVACDVIATDFNQTSTKPFERLVKILSE